MSSHGDVIGYGAEFASRIKTRRAPALTLSSQPPSLTRRNRFNKFIYTKNHQSIPVYPLKMSDAPAAPVTENGVPPAAQESVVEETPGFKVCPHPSLTWHAPLTPLSPGLRRQPCVLYHG